MFFSSSPFFEILPFLNRRALILFRKRFQIAVFCIVFWKQSREPPDERLFQTGAPRLDPAFSAPRSKQVRVWNAPVVLLQTGESTPNSKKDRRSVWNSISDAFFKPELPCHFPILGRFKPIPFSMDPAGPSRGQLWRVTPRSYWTRDKYLVIFVRVSRAGTRLTVHRSPYIRKLFGCSKGFSLSV